MITGTAKRYYYDDQRIVLQTDVDTLETDLRYFIYGNYIDEVLLMANCSQPMPGDYYYDRNPLHPVA